MAKNYEVRFPTIQEFRNYLKGLKQNDPAAPFCQKGSCPIAQWALDTLDLPARATVAVDGTSIEVYHKGHRIAVIKSAPDWVNSFIREIDAVSYQYDEEQAIECGLDSVYDLKGVDEWRFLPVSAAVKVLAAVEKEYF